MVSNGGLLKPHKLREYVAAGLSSFVISIDAASAELHEEQPRPARRLRQDPGGQQGDRRARLDRDRLGDLEPPARSRPLPAFLTDLGFESVTFSYPLTQLNSSFLGFKKSDMVDFGRDELIDMFDKVKALKSRVPRRQSDAIAGGDAAVPARRAAASIRASAATGIFISIGSCSSGAATSGKSRCARSTTSMRRSSCATAARAA